MLCPGFVIRWDLRSPRSDVCTIPPMLLAPQNFCLTMGPRGRGIDGPVPAPAFVEVHTQARGFIRRCLISMLKHFLLKSRALRYKVLILPIFAGPGK